jgi:hypothetical protein
MDLVRAFVFGSSRSKGNSNPWGARGSRAHPSGTSVFRANQELALVFGRLEALVAQAEEVGLA